jgi:hypothetical protein
MVFYCADHQHAKQEWNNEVAIFSYAHKVWFGRIPDAGERNKQKQYIGFPDRESEKITFMVNEKF